MNVYRGLNVGLAPVGNVASYLKSHQVWGELNLGTSFKRELFDSSQSLYNRDLVAHFGCVNALEFSNKDGELLATAGDDKRILLWKVGEMLLDLQYTPTCMDEQHLSNVFCLAFDNQNQMIISSGNDEQIIIHNIVTKQEVGTILANDAVYSISAHPNDINLFAAASENGELNIYDRREEHTRRSKSTLSLSSNKPAFHGVMFNPYEPIFVAASHSRDGASLWDLRKPKSALIKYSPSQLDSGMSVRFNDIGTELLVLRRRGGPVLYSTHNPEPIATFKESGYCNSCTMKSGCFAGENDEFVVSGSDDFNVYLWRKPLSSAPDRIQPVVRNAKMVLKGHKSIVNQVRYNKHSQILLSSGVEKAVKLWSPFRYPTCRGLDGKAPASTPARNPYSRDDYIDLVLLTGSSMIGQQGYGHESTAEDPLMIAFFDGLIQHDLNRSSDDSDANGNANRGSRQLLYDLQNGPTSSSSESEDGGLDEGIGRYLMARLTETAWRPDTTNTLARLQSLRARITEEESSDLPPPDVEDTNSSNDVRSNPPVDLGANPASVSNGSTSDSEESSSLRKKSGGGKCKAPRTSKLTEDRSSEMDSDSKEDKHSSIRQRNARRKRKKTKWVATVTKESSDDGSSSSKVANSSLFAEQGSSCSHDNDRSAYDRSLDKLDESVMKTNSRLAKVADHLARVLHESTGSDEDEEVTVDLQEEEEPNG